MKAELYKIFKRKYLYLIGLLLILPIILGIGNVFNLAYIVDSNSEYINMIDYAADMFLTIRFMYFFVIIFLSADMVSTEITEGQIKFALSHVTGRWKIILSKIFAFLIYSLVGNIIIWGVNVGLYMLSEIMSNSYGNNKILYADFRCGLEIMISILVASLMWNVITMFISMFVKKSAVTIVTYFIWIIMNYVDKIVELKNIIPEYRTIFLCSNIQQSISFQSGVYLVGILLSGIVACLTIVVFEKKDII